MQTGHMRSFFQYLMQYNPVLILFLFVISPIVVLPILSFLAITACHKIGQTQMHQLYVDIDAEYVT